VKLHICDWKHVAAFAVLAVGIGILPDARAQMKDPSLDLPNPYHQVEGWAKELPDGRQWGIANAIAIDPGGHIWVAERCGGSTCASSDLPPVIELDAATGKVLKTFGAGLLVVPHGIYFDRVGNMWLTDNGGTITKGQQIIKFSPTLKELMRLGKAGVASDADDTFNQPNAVIVATNGDIFVGDGHTPNKGNQRVMKFSKDGKFIKKWGELGSGPGQFNVPHALAFDSKGRLFVADRANCRIQIFDQDGKFLDQWKQFGQPSGIFIDRNDTLYVTDSQSQSTDPKAITYNPGYEQGIRIGSARDGKVKEFIPMPHPANVSTNTPEGIVADAKGNLYVGDVVLKGVRKFVK